MNQGITISLGRTSNDRFKKKIEDLSNVRRAFLEMEPIRLSIGDFSTNVIITSLTYSKDYVEGEMYLELGLTSPRFDSDEETEKGE